MSRAISSKQYIANQVFVGLPWKTVKPKYERIIRSLETRFPLYFSIVGRDDGKDAQNLFELIKSRIQSSSEAIFDATGGNANVSLEFGYAEGIEVKRTIFLSEHKSSQRVNSGSPIISDLSGHRRVHYKNEDSLKRHLEKFCKDHDFNKRFDKAIGKVLSNKNKGQKKTLPRSCN